jgi:hypothetical protein
VFNDCRCTHDHFGAAGDDFDDLSLLSLLLGVFSFLEEQYVSGDRAAAAAAQTTSAKKPWIDIYFIIEDWIPWQIADRMKILFWNGNNVLFFL